MKSDSEDDLKKRFKDLCLDLNLDKTSADEAWQSFQRIGINYTLEGDKLHWLACAVYVACKKCVTQTIGKVGRIQGNCVSLTRLLRSCKLSLVQFFNKIKKWSDMANLSAEMRQKVDHLERNFNVSTVIFMKYKPIFEQIFKNPNAGQTKQAKNRKQSRKQAISCSDIFSFCWTLFVHIKSNYTQISDDLVNSYHLLLASIDYCFANALNAENAHELLNPEFSELPSDFNEDSYKSPESPKCIIQSLCEKWDGIYIDAKGIKEHWAKPYIKRMFERDLLRAKNINHFSLFDSANFDYNIKSIAKEYDQYVLNYGDFDERIFLCENANEEIGTTQCNVDELTELMQKKQASKLANEQSSLKSFCESTPLSNRHYLNNRTDVTLTPISNATHSVSRIQSLLLGRKDEPSEVLEKIFSECKNNPKETIVNRVKAMGEKFVQAYCQPNADDIQSILFDSQSDEFAKKRLSLAVTLYYKFLENILNREKKIKGNDSNESLSAIISQESFHVSLFSCALEIILFCYTTNRTFPWILEVFSDGELKLFPFNFYKVIEPVIRDEDGLTREIVKHLNSVEERILECLAWKSNSPLWDNIKNCGPVPSCAEVALPGPVGEPPILSSPSSSKRFDSPFSNSPVTDRFMSPLKGTTAKRQLFPKKEPGSISQSGQIVQIAIQTQTATGEIKYIQVPAIAVNITPQQQTPATSTVKEAPNEPQRTTKVNSLGLFFRKVYNLAGLRLRDLCDRLSITNDDELRTKIWTCLEYTLRKHTDLMRDRHIDQIMMCACYAICKVTKHNQTFQEIMNCYRKQPQCNSHVYRSVLLNTKKRRNSGSSDTSRTSGSSSPILQEDKDRIRSSSTLPVPHPNSQPPTPTRVAGTGTHFEFEERGDIIMFYNNVYLPELTKFIMKFTSNGQSGLNIVSPPLSPLPRLQATAMSPYRKISSKYPVYISPLKTANFPPSPKRPMSYRFLSSPAKDLHAINNMMRGGSLTPNSRKVSKRILLQDDGECENSPTKRCATENVMNRRIVDVVNERQSFSGSNGDSIAD